jgi:metal-responsive CopG/Arc/MetJ family transcriptional regulator
VAALARQVDRVARSEGRSRSELLREAFQQYVGRLAHDPSHARTVRADIELLAEVADASGSNGSPATMPFSPRRSRGKQQPS